MKRVPDLEKWRKDRARLQSSRKNRVRDACGVLQQQYGRNVWFATLTLPGSTGEALRACAAWSGYLMERVRQWLRDSQLGEECVAVWELQRRGALHMHLALPMVAGWSLSRLFAELHHMWCVILERTSVKAGVDLFAREGGLTWRKQKWIVRIDVQKVEKSVGQYLSKYISKRASKWSSQTSYCPTRWWSLSRNLLEKSGEARRLLVSPTMSHEVLSEWFERVSGIVCGAGTTTFAITNPWRPGDRTVSIWFNESEAAAQALVAALDSLAIPVRAWENKPTPHSKDAHSSHAEWASFFFQARHFTASG